MRLDDGYRYAWINLRVYYEQLYRQQLTKKVDKSSLDSHKTRTPHAITHWIFQIGVLEGGCVTIGVLGVWGWGEGRKFPATIFLFIFLIFAEGPFYHFGFFFLPSPLVLVYISPKPSVQSQNHPFYQRWTQAGLRVWGSWTFFLRVAPPYCQRPKCSRPKIVLKMKSSVTGTESWPIV